MKKERPDISPNALEILTIQFQNRRSNLHFQPQKISCSKLGPGTFLGRQ